MRARISTLALVVLLALVALPLTDSREGVRPDARPEPLAPHPAGRTTRASAHAPAASEPDPGPRAHAPDRGRLAEARETVVRWQGARRGAGGPDAEPPRRERLSGPSLALLEGAGLLAREGEPFTTGGITHVPVTVRKHGLPVFDRGGRIHQRGATPFATTGRFRVAPLAAAPAVRIGRDAALAAARAATGTEALLAPPRTRLGWATHEGATRLAYEVLLVSRAPLADWRVWVDAADGRVLGQVDRLTRVDGVGVVFETNPRDSKEPTPQVLRELDGGGTLAGRFAAVFDEGDFLAREAFAPDLHFEFPTTDPRFVQTSVYRGLTETALLAEQHGFPSTAAVPAFTGLIDPFTGEALNNAFYAPSVPLFGFGDGDGELLANLGTDIDVPAHEFGHHVFEVLVTPLVFSFEDPVLAMSEGVADTFSMLIGGDPRVGNSVLPGKKSLRNLANDAIFPDDAAADPHETGEIFGGANRDIALELGEAAFADLLVASLPFLPPEADSTDYPEAFQMGDAALNSGANQAFLDDVFTARGFDTLELPPEFRGEILAGMPETGELLDGGFHFYVFADLPPSEELLFETTGSGDVDLFVLPLDFDEDTEIADSAFAGSEEDIVINAGSKPSIDEDEFWLIVVQDWPDFGSSSYELTVTATPAAVDDVTIGGAEVQGSILDPDDEIDFLQFSGTAGDYVRVAARRVAGTIDPVVAVLSREPFEVLGVDDDSGGGAFGVDAFLQGVELPATGLYAVAVLSAAADFDPSFGTGGYGVTLTLCDNVGPDTDMDGDADDCDQDDDDDGFVDADDLDPLDPAVCIDVDVDGCNDCDSGEFDFLNDGPDADSDAICDAGDSDDDNDGCEDGIDPAPFTPSVDDDLDFLGLDCDNCADVPNPLQEDTDDDGQGDACSACTRIAWTDPPTEPADQNPGEAALQLSGAEKEGRTKLRFSGAFRPADPDLVLDPASTGLTLRLADALGPVLEVVLPGEAPCDPKELWSVKGAKYSYKNRSGALPPGCVPGSAGGLSSIRLTDERAEGGAIAFDLSLKNATLPGPLARPLRFLQVDLVLGEPTGPGPASAAGDAGECAEAVVRPGSMTAECKIKEKDGVITKVSCKAP